MELRDLRTFVAVVELGGMTRAARRLHVAQSAVSQAVKRLEREYGLELLERRSDGVHATAAGDVLAAHARRILDNADRLQADMASYRGRAKGVVGIGIMSTIAPLVLAPIVRSVDAQAPDVTLRVKEGVAGELLDALRFGRLDLVVFVGPVNAEELKLVSVGQLSLCVVLSRRHRLAGRPTITLGEVAEESWITFPPSNPARRWLDDSFRKIDCRPIVSAEIGTVTQLKAFVEAGHGIALLPREVVSLEERTHLLQTVPLAPPTAVTIGYVYEPSQGGAAVALVRSFIEQELQRLARMRAGVAAIATH